MSKRVPKLPSFIAAPGRDVPVKIVAGRVLKDGRLGDYDPKTREIRISSAISLDVQWQILFHEWTHLVLFDSGLHNIIPEDLHEIICDAFALFRMHEFLARKGS